MNRDEIVQIAWDVGILMRSHHFQDEPTKLERFAERIAAAEREACAKVCERISKEFVFEPRSPDPVYCADAIRARGET
jgi:hypothetical protein